MVFQSARSGWIERCFVFIINPQIEARKATKEETNLVDEWRCYYNIPVNDIVGIALPFKSIEEYLEEKDEYYNDDCEMLKAALIKIKEMAIQKKLPIYDSEQENFTDELDSSILQIKRM